jgi:nitrogen regulatory protein PII-like uncharacterized protein
MKFIVENNYTKKLFIQLNMTLTNLQLIALADVASIDAGHDFIVDEDDYETFEALQDQAREVIVLTDKKKYASSVIENVRCIKKFQSTKNILTLVSQEAFPMTYLGFTNKSDDKEAIIREVSRKYDIDRVISLDFSPSSSFSLFDSLTRNVNKVSNQTNLDVIANIHDYLNPPIADLITYLNCLKETNRLLIVSSPLKGALDAALMDLSDTIILVENDKTMKLATHLDQRIKSKRFEVMTYDTLS